MAACIVGAIPRVVPLDLDAIRQAITDADALGVTESQLYELAKAALADALRAGTPTVQMTLPTGMAYTLDLATVRGLVAELRSVAQSQRGGSIAYGQAVLP